jgi:hypothetical protein
VCPEHWDSRLLQNVCICPWKYVMLHPRRQILTLTTMRTEDLGVHLVYVWLDWVGTLSLLNCGYHCWSVILTNKHNNTDLIYWSFFQCCYMFWLVTSGRHHFTERVRRGEVCPNKQWCEII